MAKINKEDIYLPDTTVSREDTWVGSDSQDYKKTKTFRAGDLLDFILGNYGGSEQNNFVTEKPLGVIDISISNAFVNAMNNLTAYTVAANEIIVFTGEFSELGTTLNTKFVYILKSGKGVYGNGGTVLTINDVILVNPKQPETERNTQIINALISEDKIYSGILPWIEGTFDFEALGFVFGIGGTIYAPENKVLTVSPQHDTLGRFNSFVCDSVTGEVIIIEGVASATPLAPLPLYGEQLFITSIFIPSVSSGDTLPQIEDSVDFEVVTISNELDASPTEWDLVSTPSGVDIIYTTDPLNSGSKYIKIGSSVSGQFSWEGLTPIQLTTNGFIKFALKLDAPLSQVSGSTSYMYIFLYSGILYKGVSLRITVPYLIAYGLDNSSLDWQEITVPMSSFTYNGSLVISEFSKFGMQFFSFGGCAIDNIRTQSGALIEDYDGIIEKTSDIPINDGATGESPYAEMRDLTLNTRITATGVSGTYNLDHSLADDWKLTLTGNTTLTDSNLPTGTKTTDFTLKVTGSFILTPPSTWISIVPIQGDAYDGTKWNFYTVHVGNGTLGSEDITVFRTALQV